MIPWAAQCLSKLTAANSTAGAQDLPEGAMQALARFCSDMGVAEHPTLFGQYTPPKDSGFFSLHEFYVNANLVGLFGLLSNV